MLGALGHLPQPSLPFLGISTCQRGYPGATPGLSHPLRSHSSAKGSLIVPGMGNCPKSPGEKAEAGEKEGGFTLSHQSSRGVCISSLLTHLGKVCDFTPSSETQGWACARELQAWGHLTEGSQGLQAVKDASYRLGPSSCSQLWTLTGASSGRCLHARGPRGWVKTTPASLPRTTQMRLCIQASKVALKCTHAAPASPTLTSSLVLSRLHSPFWLLLHTGFIPANWPLSSRTQDRAATDFLV